MSSVSTTKKPSKRDEYTSHACTECQRRKVKCSGQSPCHNCLGRGAECSYQDPSNGSSKRKRKQASSNTNKRRAVPPSRLFTSASEETALLKEQLQRLQQGLDTLMMQQSLSFDFLSSHNTPPLPNQTNISAPSPDEPPLAFSQSIEALEPQSTTHNAVQGSPSSCQDDRQPAELTYAETDTFVPGSKFLNRFAVASQICDLRSSVGADPVLPNTTPSKSCTVVLPCPKDLTQAIKVGLAGVDCFFPSIHGTRLVEAISVTLKALCYSSTTQSVVVTEPHHLVISILLVIIAAGQNLDDKACPDLYLDKAWPGSEAYWQSRKLVQHFEGGSELQTNCVIYHTFSAAYLLAAERLRLASIHVLNGLHSAVSLGLGQSHGFPISSEDFVDPLALWVTLDFLDKRITQKCGIPYFVGNSLGHVDFEHETSPHIDVKSKAYLKTMFSHARLWASIWDGFLAPNAPMASDWVEIQAFDAKLLALREQYPDILSWNGESVDNTIFKSPSEPEDRRRLLVFLRYQSLRLSIRQRTLSPPETNSRRVASCLRISIESLDGIGHYLDNWGANPNAGYILTSSLVESIYYLTLGHREGVPMLDAEALPPALHRAGSMLESLSATIVSAARAFKALQCVLNFNFHESRPNYDLLFPLAGFPESNMNFGMPVDQVEYPSSTETFDFSKSFDAMISNTMAGPGLEVSSVLAEMFTEIEAR
ncbi:putative transcriptional regulatory protein [Fusarium oxysporum f. sp. cubense]|uniref:Putative transcriptional regulatory protein n=1 Tax=Fusarium oxysporum f. sp. cubense TaxID=61366 RepID=A0A559KT26_FUSOC|nr:putative transcriptional regulatory protein [Fusarium oxysporum f. sp. cubense]